MIKFIFKNLLIVTCIVSAFLSQTAQATLIESDLTTNDYVSFGNLDFAWASPVNVENWDGLNTLKAPDFHVGWDFATDLELDILKANLSLADFTRVDGSYIHAVKYWNDSFTDVVVEYGVDVNGDPIIDSSNLESFIAGDIRSYWTLDFNNNTSDYETFYVRRNGVAQTPNPVPEPSTLLIFAMGLLALTFKARKQS